MNFDHFMGSFSESEKAEVQEFLDVREYELALWTLACIFDQEEKPLDAAMLQEINEIASAMGLQNESYMVDLALKN